MVGDLAESRMTGDEIIVNFDFGDGGAGCGGVRVIYNTTDHYQ